MKSVALAFVAVVVGTSSAMAQVGSGATLEDRSTQFRQFDFQTSGTTTTISDYNLVVTRPTTSPDHAFEGGWWFRGANDAREFQFANATNRVATADTLSVDFATVAGVTANLFIDVNGTDYARFGAVTQRVILTNTTGSDITLDLFHYADFDVNGTSTTDTYSVDTTLNRVFTISDGGYTITFTGFGATAHEASIFGASPTLRSKLTDADVDNLNNTVTGSPGDFTGAFQWSFVIPANGSVTAQVEYSVVPAPASVALLGLGGLLASRRRR